MQHLEPFTDVMRVKAGRNTAALVCLRNAKALIRVPRHIDNANQFKQRTAFHEYPIVLEKKLTRVWCHGDRFRPHTTAS
jgi:hypothetical protein